jgi:hypothetical protein
MMPVFTHSAYLREHWRQPRGRGPWAFRPATSWRALDGELMDESPFVANGTLNEAKLQAGAYYRRRGLPGDVLIAVLP